MRKLHEIIGDEIVNVDIRVQFDFNAQLKPQLKELTKQAFINLPFDALVPPGSGLIAALLVKHLSERLEFETVAVVREPGTPPTFVVSEVL